MNLDGTPASSGQAVRMVRESWNPEDPDATLRFDSALGIVDVGRPSAPGEWLAVGYATENQSASAHNGTPSAQPGDTVRVLAPPQRDPDHQPYWNLELKNVYDVGLRADLTDFHLQLRCVPDSTTEFVYEGVDYPLTTLFCLNTCGGPAGETAVDPQWLDAERGLLWFPVNEPFSNGDWSRVYRWVGFWALYGNLCTTKSWWHDPPRTGASGAIYQVSYDDPARPAAAAIYELVVTRSWLR